MSKVLTEYDRPTLTRSDVARKLKVHYRTVIRLVDARLLAETRLPATNGGRSTPRYSEAAVDAYLCRGYTK